MGLLSKNKHQNYGVIIDIGSGSVLVAIVASDKSRTHPDIIWSKREYAPLKQISSISESAKSVMASLLNALMLLNSEGRKVFREKTGVNKLPEAQITIAAPWSYTVTKTITYKHEEPFTVSEDLVEELLRTAHTKINEELEVNERAHDLGLKIISRKVIALIANGYPIKIVTNQKAKTLQIIEANAIAQEYLFDAINDARDKILPDTNITLYSFILLFYYLMQEFSADINDYCLVDITFEATELGVIRNGALNYTTHTPYGSFSLAREIAAVLKVPLEEAFSYLKQEDPETFFSDYSTKQKSEINTIFTNYQDRLVALFKETGDSLSIPKKIFLHGNLYTEPFFKKHVAVAAKKATNGSHAIYTVSSDLVTKFYTKEDQILLLADQAEDTAMLISAQFFHLKQVEDDNE